VQDNLRRERHDGSDSRDNGSVAKAGASNPRPFPVHRPPPDDLLPPFSTTAPATRAPSAPLRPTPWSGVPRRIPASGRRPADLRRCGVSRTWRWGSPRPSPTGPIAGDRARHAGNRRV